MRDETWRDVRLRVAVVAATLVPRVFIGFLSFGSVDTIANFRNNLRIFQGDWAQTPYFPFLELWLWIAGHLTYATDLPVIFPYKLLPILCDVLIALLLFESAPDRRIGTGNAMLFALSPVSIYVTAIHVQWDSIWMAFLLLALVVLRIDSGRSAVTAGMAFVLAIVPKPIALPLGPVMLPRGWRRIAAFAAGAAMVGAVYLVILASVGYLMSVRDFLSIVDYVQKGVQLFGLPWQPINRLWSTMAMVAALWFLMLSGKLRRDEAVLLYLASIMFLSGLAPQYLCWLIPFALFSGRSRFVAVYGLVAGVFLVWYYQVPVLNRFNVENLGAYGLLKPFGAWSPPMPDSIFRRVEQFLGNYAIPLLCLGFVAIEFVRALRSHGRREELSSPTTALRPLVAPALVLAVLIGAGTLWAAAQPRIEDVAFIYRIEQKINAYDVVRYRGPAPSDRGKIWIARSLAEAGVGNRILNVANVGLMWTVVWSVVAGVWRPARGGAAG